MIKITNGLTTLEVTPGAYKDIFSHQGYTPVQSVSTNQTEMPAVVSQPDGDKLPGEDSETVTESISDQETDGDTPEEISEEENLSEIPLGEMTDKQLREYADQLGVDLTGVTSRKAVRAKIRAAL